MADFMKTLKEKASEVPEYISVSEIPEEVTATIEKYQFKSDKNGVECLFLTLRTDDNKRIVQKYPPSTWKQLADIFEELGGADLLMKRKAVWKKALLGRTQKHRLVPNQLIRG